MPIATCEDQSSNNLRRVCSGGCEATVRIVENLQTVIDHSGSFSVYRELHPGLIRDAKLGFRRPVEDPNRLNELVILYRPGDASFGAKTTYPGAVIE